MKPVIDQTGKVIPGLFKKDDGSIVVKDSFAYKKNVALKTKIESMQSQIDELMCIVKTLIK